MIYDPLVKSLLTNVVEDESNLPIVQALIDGVETDEAIAEKTEIKLNIVEKSFTNFMIWDWLLTKEVKTRKHNGLLIPGNLKNRK